MWGFLNFAQTLKMEDRGRLELRFTVGHVSCHWLTTEHCGMWVVVFTLVVGTRILSASSARVYLAFELEHTGLF